MDFNKPAIVASVVVLGIAMLTGCGSSEVEKAADTSAESAEPAVVTAPDVSFKPAGTQASPAGKASAPFQLEYKIIGTPIVGSPVPIELRITPAGGPQPMRLSYNINDVSALEFPAAQPASVNLEPAANERIIEQVLTVIPKREGRLYVNVSASIETEEGARSMVVAIPVQVGEGVRQVEPNGELATNEEGEAIRVLPGKDD